MLQPPTDQAEDEHEPPPPPPPAPSGGTPRPVRRSRSRTGNTPPGHGSPTHGSPPRPFGGSPPSPPGPPSILRTAPAPASSTPFGRGSRPSAATPRQPATTPPISGSRRNKRQPAAPKLPAKASDSKSKINVAGSRQSPGWVGPTKDRPSPPELTIPTTSPPAPGSPGSSPGKREVFQLRKQIAQLQEENSKLNDQTNGYMSNQAALSKKLEEQDSAHKELEQTLKSVLPQLATGAQDGGNKSKHGQAPQAPRAQMQVPAATLQQQQRMPAAQVLRLPGNAGGRGVEKGLPQMLPDNSCFHFSILGVLLCLALAVLLLLNGHSECGMPAEDPPTQPAWVIPDGSSSVLPPPALPVVQAAGTDEHGGQLPATPAAAEAEARAAVRASAATFGTQGSVDKEETPLLRTQRREAREAEKPATAASDRLRRKLASAAGLGPAMMVAPAAKPPTTGAATGGDKPSNPAALLQAAVQANECKSAPCQNGGTCSDLVGKYKCQCAGGWAGDNCEVSSGSTAQEKLNAATKLREAVRKMLQAKTKPVAPAAEDSATEPEETAEAAATAPAAATATEADQDDLGAEEWQAALLSAHDECKSVPCQNGGSCSDLLGHYQCVCVKGWRGANCEVNFDDCASSPCVNDALGCEDGVDEFKCTCSDGWEADDCSVEIDECGSHPCAHGSCADVVAGYECTCTDGWVGENCAEDVDECLSLPCNNGGTCGQVDDGASPFYTCGCVAGFEGDECGLDVDECESLPCLRGGACSDGVASYECKCVDGFIGERCDVDVDECLSSPCENGGSCVESSTHVGLFLEHLVGVYECQCQPGWIDANCGTDRDECASSPCKNDALSCEDGLDSFKCTCSKGWEADDCSVDFDECASGPCVHGSCMDNNEDIYIPNAGYECTCTDGWVGENCAEDVDECLSLPCNNGGTCGQVDDGASPFYTCGCVAGFEGDECGLDVDECESLPCLRGGACSDGVASYECKCVDGFIGERCDVDVDECLSSPCENGGSCVESGTVGHEAAVGSYFCACAEGWAGTDCGRTTVEIMVAEDRERRAAERAKGARRRQMQEEAARQADVAAAAEAAARGAAAGASRVGGRVGVQKPKLAMSEIVGRRAATAGLAGQPPPSEMGPPPPRSMGPPPPRALARPPPPPPQQQQAAAPPPAPQLATEDDALAAVRDARLVQQAARPPPPPPPVVRAAVVSEADQAFERFDTNGSGVLETEEARLLVAKVGLEMSTAELTAITEALRDRATFGQIMRPYLHVLV